MLAAIAVGIATTWIDDGDGTCGALYKPNFARLGCSRKLMAAGVVAGSLAGGAVLAWDAARRKSHVPGRVAVLGVTLGIVAAFVLFVVKGGDDRRSDVSHDPAVTTAPTAPPPPPPGPRATPLTTPPR